MLNLSQKLPLQGLDNWTNCVIEPLLHFLFLLFVCLLPLLLPLYIDISERERERERENTFWAFNWLSIFFLFGSTQLGSCEYTKWPGY